MELTAFATRIWPLFDGVHRPARGATPASRPARSAGSWCTAPSSRCGDTLTRQFNKDVACPLWELEVRSRRKSLQEGEGQMSWLALHRTELEAIRQGLEHEGLPERDALPKLVALLDRLIEELPTEIGEVIATREGEAKLRGDR